METLSRGKLFVKASAQFLLLALVVAMTGCSGEAEQEANDGDGDGYPMKLRVHSGYYQTISNGEVWGDDCESLSANYAYKPIIIAYGTQATWERNIAVYVTEVGSSDFEIDNPSSTGNLLGDSTSAGYTDTIVAAEINMRLTNCSATGEHMFIATSTSYFPDTFYVMVINDPEITDGTVYTHERDPNGQEVRGDGLADGTGKKTLKIEVDYEESVKWQIDSIIMLMHDILVTADIDVIIAKDEELSTFTYNGLRWNDCFSMLEENRCDTMLDRVHLIIGGLASVSDFQQGLAGIAVHRWQGAGGAPGGWSHYNCRKFANSRNVTENRRNLDKSGCFVFAKTVIDALDAYSCDSRWNGRAGILALLSAHEIGHAMGITYHTDRFHRSVMFDYPLDSLFGNIDYNYDMFNKFDGIELDHPGCRKNLFQSVKSSVNMRDLLGVTTVDIGS
jgi:hypothetical protein